MIMHDSHRAEMKHAVLTILVMAVILLLVTILPVSPFEHGMANYLPLHIVLEVAAISMAAMIFTIGWNAIRLRNFLHVYWLSAVFLGVAALDTLHMLSFAGMPTLITESNPQKAINFWLAARLLAALGLLLSALFHDVQRPLLNRNLLLAVVGLLVVVSTVWFLGYPQSMPDTYIEGEGLTPLKIGFEYGLMALYLFTAVLLLRSMRQPRSFHAAGLFASTLIMAMSEFLFTLYGEVTDLYNLLGHIYKVVAYLFLYRALFVESVQQPYFQLLESRLRHQQEELDYFFEANLNMFCIGGLDGQFLRVNSAWERVLGCPRQELEGRNVLEFVHPDDRQLLQDSIARIAVDEHTVSFQCRLLDKQGGVHALEWRAIARDSQVYVSATDITERRQHEAQIRRLSSVVEQNPSPVIVTDLDGRIEYVNAAFTRVSGYDKAEVLGRTPSLLKSGLTPPQTYRSLWESLRGGGTWQGELINRNKCGELYTESALIYPLRDEQGEVVNYIAHKEDISARRAAEKRIEELSHYDQVTGLPNRDLLRSRFNQLHERNGKRTRPLTLIWLDLDNFKAINDTLGHDLGDLVLREIALRLRTLITAQDTLGRHSGDDFILLLPDIDQDRAATLAEELLALIQQPLQLSEEAQELTVTASLGLAIGPSDGDSFELLMACAEAAMYRSKKEGRNNFRFYAPEMQAHSLRKLALSNALSHALARDELWLAYQPQYDLTTQRMSGAEVLLRWRNPQWGNVSPAEFIPLAESNGQIVAIGEWVMQQAARQLKQWRQLGMADMKLAINLSALQFMQPDLVASTEAIVHGEGLTPGDFELELTEAVALNNPDDAGNTMAALRKAGFSLSIDDFGTGYSSMSYLKRFAVDKLKIDQSFVRELDKNKADQGIAIAIIQLAHTLKMKVIAEGVEEHQQLGFLASHGCDAIQGYHFSRPLPAADFEQFWRDQTEKAAP